MGRSREWDERKEEEEVVPLREEWWLFA